MASSQVTRIVSCVKVTPRLPAELQPNLLLNPDFDDATVWTVFGTPVIAGGVCTFDGNSGSISQNATGMVEGDVYEIGCEIVSVDSQRPNKLAISLGGKCLPNLVDPIPGIWRVVASAGSLLGTGFLAGGCGVAPDYFNGVIDNTFCRRLIATPRAPVGITDCDMALVVDGVTYESIHGYTPSRMVTSSDMSVGNAEIEGILATNGIGRDDIINGVYNGALIEWFTYDLDLGAVRRINMTGYLGEVKLYRNRYVAEIRDLSQPLRQNMLELTSPTCRCERFGDYRCRLDLAPWTVTGTVGTSLGNRQFIDNARGEDAGHFRRGTLVWGIGSANDGAVSKVKFDGDRSGDRTFELADVLANDIVAADAYTLVAGCDRTFERCIEFDNAINFQGEPNAPNQDTMNEYGGQR